MKTILLLMMVPLLAFSQSEKELKQAEKERLKQPAQMTVKAPADELRQALVKEMLSAGYSLDQEGQFKLSFSRSIEGWAGFAAQLAHGYRNGVPPRTAVDYTIMKNGDELLVIADIGIVSGNAFGKTDRANYNRDKKSPRNR